MILTKLDNMTSCGIGENTDPRSTTPSYLINKWQMWIVLSAFTRKENKQKHTP